MLSVLTNALKNLETNSLPLSDVTWVGVPCFENTSRMKTLDNFFTLIVLLVGTKITCFMSLFMTTSISVYIKGHLG